VPYVDWTLRGPQIATCNCAWGCPCQFNGLPTNGDCRAAVAMRIDTGHFGEVPLDGLKWVGLFAWPRAIHEGNGEALAIVDERASQAQRNALLTILSGQEQEPGATYFNVFASTIAKMNEPQFQPIQFDVAEDGISGSFSVPGIVTAQSGPIRNPMTGAAHRARVVLPHGFEFLEAEFGSSTTHSSGAVPLDWAGRHAHVTMIDIGPYGPARAQTRA
jgi:hypothetical protein